MPAPTRPNFARLPPPLIAVAAFLLLLLIAYVDYVTPADLSMALFYLLPVALATWFIGRRAGYIMACVCAVTWLSVELRSQIDIPSYHDIRFAYLNALTRLGFFLVAVPVLSSWRTQGQRLTKMVEERTSELRAEVAERQRAESALRQLAAQLSAVEDAERRRFAYDLHDGLGQMLSLLKMNLEAGVSKAAAGDGHERMVDAVQMVDALIKQTRSLTFDLHPAMLDDLGLVATLKGYSRDFGQRANIDVAVTDHGEAKPLPTTTAHYLFRAVKELLSNAARHGKASEIVIAVHWETARLRLVIDDDGCGFDADEIRTRQRPRGLGLPGIGERLQSLGGAIHIESSQGQGTRVIVEAPLEAHLQPAGFHTQSHTPAPADAELNLGLPVSPLPIPVPSVAP